MVRLRVSVWSAPVALSLDYMSCDIEDHARQGSLSTFAVASVAEMRRGNGAEESPRRRRHDASVNVVRERVCMCLIRSR